MKKYPIDPSPKKYNNKWLIFDETVFDSIEIPDCKYTIEGVCYTDISMDKCIEKCNLNNNCSHGYYLTSKDSKSNICIPLYTPNFDKDQNYSYNLINIKNYNLDYNGQAFLDTSVQVFPPKDNGFVSYNDTVKIQESNTNRFISMNPFDNKMLVDLSNSTNISFKITQPIDDTSFRVRNLKYSANFLLVFKESNITFGIKEGEEILSTQTITDFNRLSSNQVFNAKPINYKQDNTIIKYFENFILNYGDVFIKTDKDGNLVYTKKMSDATEFNFRLEDPIYKCIDGKCTSINLNKDTDLNNVYSDNDCFNTCGKPKSKETVENYTYGVNKKANTLAHIIILSILMLLLIIILLFS
jgi:hypothetical protein